MTKESGSTGGDSFIAKTAAAYLRSTVLALIAFGLMEALTVLLRSRQMNPLMFSYLSVTWGASFWIAIAITAHCAALEILVFVGGGANKAKTLLNRWLRTALICSSGAVVGVILFRPWDLFVTWPYWLVPLGGAICGVGFLLLRRWLPEKYFTTTLFLGAVLCFTADATAYRHLYLAIHQLLFFMALSLASAGFFRLQWQQRRLSFGAILLALGCQLTLFSTGSDVVSLATTHGVVAPKVLSLVHLTVDGDGDGHAAVFGGGDCDDTDRSIHPGACERPNQDRNCNGHRGIAALSRPQSSGKKPNDLSKLQSPDIYLVLIDTLRADYGRATRQEVAPEIHRFAEQSLDFVAAYTPYPATFQASVSLVQARNWRSTLEDHPHALELLAKRGYDTQLWIAERRMVIQPGTGFLRLGHQDSALFLKNQWVKRGDSTKEIVDEAIREMKDKEASPRFRWLHFLDPHVPVRAQGKTRLDRYRNAIRKVSHEFGRLLKALDSSSRGRQAVVILLADHGEEFFDHGALYHSTTLYQEGIQVPLVMRLPGVKGKKVPTVSSLIDVFPTVFDALGWKPDATWQGTSRLHTGSQDETIFTQVRPDADFSGYWAPEFHAVVGRRYKLIYDLKRNLVQVFDLKEDPKETKSIAEQKPKITRKLFAQLALFQDGASCR